MTSRRKMASESSVNDEKIIRLAISRIIYSLNHSLIIPVIHFKHSISKNEQLNGLIR